jgi:hypothetical protein
MKNVLQRLALCGFMMVVAIGLTKVGVLSDPDILLICTALWWASKGQLEGAK